ncbi:MAG TPA: class I SAM-dependent methyltransferase [Candidatus Krumholzibacteria bacterium]
MASRDAPDRNTWQELYATGARPDRPPSSWIVDTVAALPNDGPVADVAGGTGRHAVPVARGGRRVVVVDFVAGAVARAMAREPSIDGVVADVTRLPLRKGAFGVVIVANFLDRTIFPELIALLEPGGYLVYETYTFAHHELVEQGLARGPQSTKFLLRPAELPDLVKPLAVRHYWEGEVEDEAGRRCCARLVASA